MAFPHSFAQAQLPFKVKRTGLCYRFSECMRMNKRSIFAFRSVNEQLFVGRTEKLGTKLSTEWSFPRRSIASIHPNLGRAVDCRVYASSCLMWKEACEANKIVNVTLLALKILLLGCAGLPSSQLAASVFTFGTVAVLPFYTLMVAAPKAELTKKLMESSIPYIMLGLLYAYLLYLSWTPDTLRLMFSSQNWLPELSAIAKLFSSEMTLASAWIHLLAVDLFAARQVFHDGLQDNVETRHSVSLCLLFCPIGVLAHFITKALTSKVKQQIH